MVHRNVFNVLHGGTRNDGVPSGHVGGMINAVPHHANASNLDSAEDQHQQDRDRNCEFNRGCTPAIETLVYRESGN